MSQPALSELSREQLAVQADKTTARSISEYDSILFGSKYIARFLSDQVPGSESLPTLLEGLIERREDGKASWTDMAGGYAIALRQIAEIDRLGRIGLTNVDVVDWDIDKLCYDKELYDHVEHHTEGFDVTNSAYAPKYIQANAETVKLPEQQDLITSVMGIMYFNDPIRAVSNWYNQLRPEGILVVSTQHNHWSSNIQLEDAEFGEPVETLQTEFDKNEIEHEVSQLVTHGPQGSYRILPRTIFGTLAIKKKAGTEIRVHSDVTKIRESREGYKRVTYSASDKPIEIVSSGTN